MPPAGRAGLQPGSGGAALLDEDQVHRLVQLPEGLRGPVQAVEHRVAEPGAVAVVPGQIEQGRRGVAGTGSRKDHDLQWHRQPGRVRPVRGHPHVPAVSGYPPLYGVGGQRRLGQRRWRGRRGWARTPAARCRQRHDRYQRGPPPRPAPLIPSPGCCPDEPPARHGDHFPAADAVSHQPRQHLTWDPPDLIVGDPVAGKEGRTSRCWSCGYGPMALTRSAELVTLAPDSLDEDQWGVCYA